MTDNNAITLRKTRQEDLEYLFHFQLDAEANYLAAFTPKNPDDQDSYMQKWTKLIEDETINMQTIIVGVLVVGSVVKYEIAGEAEITYWLDKRFWGKGIATAALKQFLTIEKIRPIYGRTAFDNVRSQRVLENCGFLKIGSDTGYANAREMEIEEYIYRLDAIPDISDLNQQ